MASKRTIDKVTISEVSDQLEIKVVVWLTEKMGRSEKLLLRGVKFPSPRSKKWQVLEKHLREVCNPMSDMAVIKYNRDAKGRFFADFYYMPAELLVTTDEPSLSTIVLQGRCLNQELFDLGLAQPSEETPPIDFKKDASKVETIIEIKTENLMAQVAMYINDCKQYLRVVIDRKPVDMESSEFDPTDQESRILEGFAELKALATEAARCIKERKDHG